MENELPEIHHKYILLVKKMMEFTQELHDYNDELLQYVDNLNEKIKDYETRNINNI